MEDTHVSYLEGEIRALQKRVEDLRNVGKVIRGKVGAREAAEALDKRIVDLESENSDLTGRVLELERSLENSRVLASMAQTIITKDVAKNVRATLEEIRRLRTEAAEFLKTTPSASRNRLDLDTRMWAHPFVESVLAEALAMVDKALEAE